MEYGEFVKEGILIEDLRKPLHLHGIWGEDAAIWVMRAAHTYQAKRIQTGVETWNCMRWPEERTTFPCVVCKLTHVQNWRGYAKRCEHPIWETYRTKVREIWQDSTRTNEQWAKRKLWGWVSKEEVAKAIGDVRGPEEGRRERTNTRIKQLKAAQRQWEKLVNLTRKKWEKLVHSEDEDPEPDLYQMAQADISQVVPKNHECTQQELRLLVRTTRNKPRDV